MNDRKKFLLKLAERSPTRVEQAIALLWHYEQTQQFTERTTRDLIKDIKEEGFGTQNISRLEQQLSSSKFTVRASRAGTFRINATYFAELTQKYGSLVNVPDLNVTSSVIPLEFVSGTRTYLERLVGEINGSYDYSFFDASMVILRRLTEGLIIEIYLKNKRDGDIRNRSNAFFQLGDLITTISNDKKINKSRSFVKGLNLIKDLGDTAAHDRTYITPRQDIDDNRLQIRRTIYELLILSGIKN